MNELEDLIKQGQQALDDRGSLLSLWQTISENFYPERADFTTNRALGAEMIDSLSTSYPVIARRDLGNALSAMLRPTSKNWFHIRTKQNWDKVSPDGRAWLEWAEDIMRRAMQHKTSQFVRATKEGDHDFAAFGQAVLQASLNSTADGLLFRCWHLRDVAWLENANGVVDTVYRKWKPKVRELNKLFPGKLHPDTKNKLDNTPYCEIDVWHVVIPSDQYPGIKTRHPFVSLYIDVAHKHTMEAVGVPELGYIIPRWSTVSGSQYAVSPATVVALPDARMLQSMIGVLLEAGEKAVNPPMAANKEVFGGNFAIFAGGITWADYSDGRLSDHFETIPLDKNGIPMGLEMSRDTREMISEAFFLNKLALPPVGQDMTAFEVGQRVQEYIRQAMPLFEPIEDEYNAPLCEVTFNILMRAGAFGSPFDMPEELRGAEIAFVFESPLHDAIEKAKGQSFMEMKSMLAEAAGIDPTVIHVVDVKAAFRDVLNAVQTPAKWLRTEAEAQARADAEDQARKTSELLAQMQQGADVAATIGQTTTAPGGVVNRG